MKPLLLIRTIFGINLKELSRLSGISAGMLCEVENGRMASAEIRKRIIDALKVGIVIKLTEDKVFVQYQNKKDEKNSES